MKSLPLVVLILPAMLLSLKASEVKPGDAIATVRANLGVPRGEAHLGNREIFYYDRGEVEARSDVVTRVSLRTEEEQAALDTKRALEAKRVQEEREIRWSKMNAEGEELKARKLADLSFRTAPLAYQVAFWEDFSRRYPGVASAEPLLEVRARLAGENEDKRKQLEQAQRLADLEARVTATENNSYGDRWYDQDRLGAIGLYSPYVNYSSFRGPRNYFPRPEAVKSVIRMYEFPLPYATSPGMPPLQPIYRKDTVNSTPGIGDMDNIYGESRSRSSRRF